MEPSSKVLPTLLDEKVDRKCKEAKDKSAKLPAGFALMHGFSATNVGKNRLTVRTLERDYFNPASPNTDLSCRQDLLVMLECSTKARLPPRPRS